MFGEKLFPNVGYPTPTSIPDETTCLTLDVPASAEWWGIVVGVLYSLILEWEWQQFEGGIERDEAAARWQVMLEDALEVASTTNTCGVVPDAETPFWDDATDVDDSSAPEDQIWYGEVEDAEAAPDELSFVENLILWSFTGLLAVGVSPAVAIAFNTIAPKFVIAQRAGDVGEIIRIVVDAQDVARIDTTGRAGEIIETPVIADPELETHQIYIIKVS